MARRFRSGCKAGPITSPSSGVPNGSRPAGGAARASAATTGAWKPTPGSDFGSSASSRAAPGICMENSRESPGDAMRYAELHCKTNFSFLEGASHADELVARAKELEYAALAVTDRESLAGVVRAHIAAKETGLKLLIGAEVYPVDAAPAVLWATDRKSYGRLSRLLTVGRRRAEKGQCRLTVADIAEHAEGLIAGVRSQGSGVGNQEESTEQRADDNKSPLRAFSPAADRSLASLARYGKIFPGRAYLLAELFHGPDDPTELARLMELSRQSGLPL